MVVWVVAYWEKVFCKLWNFWLRKFDNQLREVKVMDFNVLKIISEGVYFQ